MLCHIRPVQFCFYLGLQGLQEFLLLLFLLFLSFTVSFPSIAHLITPATPVTPVTPVFFIFKFQNQDSISRTFLEQCVLLISSDFVNIIYIISTEKIPWFIHAVVDTERLG